MSAIKDGRTSSAEIAVESDFNLEKIIRYRPFFFFMKSSPQSAVIVGDNVINLDLSQEKERLLIDFGKKIPKSVADIISQRVSYCLGCRENLSEFYFLCENDKVLGKMNDKIYGNRLVSAYSDFEALASIICSQNSSFLQYKKMVLNIVDKYGLGAFPKPRHILEKPHLLKECGVGYRDEYLINLSKFMLFKPEIDDISALSRVKGIGPYSIDIFLLFQRRKYEYLYADSLIRKIMKNDYGIAIENDRDLRHHAKRLWGKYQGLCEVYLQKFLYDTKDRNTDS